MKKIFVYGTLINSGMMSSLKYLGGATTKVPVISNTKDTGFPRVMTLDRMKDYGFDILEAYSRPIRGQLYEVTEKAKNDGTLSNLDSYEGYPSFYDKQEVVVVCDDGTETTCEMYHAKDAAKSFWSSVINREKIQNFVLTNPNDQDGPIQWKEF